MQSGDPGEIRVADVAGLPRPHLEAGRAQRLFLDHAVELADALGEREEEREGLLGHRHVDHAARRLDGDAARGAGGEIDIAGDGAELLHQREPRRARDERGVDREAFDDDGVGVDDLCRKVVLVLGEHDLGGIEAFEALTQPGAPVEEIRHVMGKELGHRALVGGRSRGVEHDGDDLQEMVFFDHNARHARPRRGSRTGREMKVGTAI